MVNKPQLPATYESRGDPVTCLDQGQTSQLDLFFLYCLVQTVNFPKARITQYHTYILIY